MGKTISIITSMYNRRPGTIGTVDALFFRSVLQHGAPDREIVILDDCSPLKKETSALFEKHAAGLRRAFGNVVYNRNQANLGFAGSFNKGIAIAGGDRLFIVNDDVYLPRDSVAGLASTLDEDPRYGIVGPITSESMTWTVQYCSQAPHLRSYSVEEIVRIEEFAKTAKERMAGRRIVTDLLSGFCFAVSKEVIARVGAFDGSFQYGLWEDFDLVRRISQDRLVVVNPAVYVHHGGVDGTSGSLIQHPFRAAYALLVNGVRYGLKFDDLRGALIHSVRGMYRGLTARGTVSELFENSSS